MLPERSGTAAVAVIVLTFDEEVNLGHCLESVCGWAQEVFVVDSFSKDGTRAVAEKYPCVFVEHAFGGYVAQRNWALRELPITAEWVFFLDADEMLTEAGREEIRALLASGPKENGFFVAWRMIFLGKWVKRGYYPTYILRLFRKDNARYLDGQFNDQASVDGEKGYLREDLIHWNRKPLAEWMTKQIGYAQLEARDILRQRAATLPARFWGTQRERVQWLRQKVYLNMPPFVRPLLYFFYRMIVRGGIFDGPTAWLYHFYQCLWLYMMIDTMVLEHWLAERDGQR